MEMIKAKTPILDVYCGRTMGIRKESKMYIPEFIAGVLTCIGIELIVMLVWAWVLYKKNKGE